MLPRLLLTPGEPAGIGPDLAIAVAQREWPAELVAVGDPGLLAERAELLGLPLELREIHLGEDPQPHLPGRLRVLPVALSAAAQPGRLDVRNAGYVLETLRLATRACTQRFADALVTGPVQKSIINEAGIAFSGHTEFLAALTEAPLPVMMLASGKLRVALATTHLPLKDVAAAISADGLRQLVRILHEDLRQRFGIRQPRILVCGLNPHAGESGHLGREEIEIIKPVLDEFRAEGWRLEGPLAADTLFTQRNLDGVDAVLAMYHDQGLPVLKFAGFGESVNITLGLPIIRTSVDHGTALELAGSGRADPGSLEAAIHCALELVQRSRGE